MTDLTPPAAPLLWTTQQVAEQLNLSLPHVYRLAREQQIPCVRIGKSLRFEPDAIRGWLRAKQAPGTTG